MAQLDPNPGLNTWRFRSIARLADVMYTVHTMHVRMRPTPTGVTWSELDALLGNFGTMGGPAVNRKGELLCVHGPNFGMFFQTNYTFWGDGRTYEMIMPWQLCQSVFCTAGEGGVELKTTYWPGPCGLLVGANKTTFYQSPPANMYITARLQRYFVTGIHPSQPAWHVYTPGRWSHDDETFEPHVSVEPAGYWSTQKRRRNVPWGTNSPWAPGSIIKDDEG